MPDRDGPAPGRVLADFEGAWALTREIRHDDPAQKGGGLFRFEGDAVFTRQGADLLYIETGELRGPGGAPAKGTRRYLWGPGLRVRFEDGRPFHDIPPEGGTARHWCDPDLYVVRYDFTRWPDWTAAWRVDGPRKAYAMLSRYRPAG